MKISDKTTVPLFAVLLAVPSFVVSILWISAINFKSDTANADNIKQDLRIDELTKSVKNIEKLVIRIDERLSHQKGR